MFQTDDTIVAIATPIGRGGIGVVRLSGSGAHRIANALCGRDARLEPRHATLARFAAEGIADQVLLTWFPAPHSYTGEDVVEVSAHGSPVLLRAIVSGAMAGGARLAEPGEFTLRAYLRGRMDLVQAEAVRDLVDAVTPLQARAAFDQLEGTLTSRIGGVDQRLFDLVARLEASLDFPEEGYHFLEPQDAAREIAAVILEVSALIADAGRGRLVREGLQAVILGAPNAGKSSLFNRLAGAGRAIVTAVPGTTRDLLTETVDVEGLAVTLVDTAGLRADAVDPIEAEGIARARAARDVASIALLVLDRSAPMGADARHLIDSSSDRARIVVANKIDLPPARWPEEYDGLVQVRVSAATGEGFEDLGRAIAAAATGRDNDRDMPAITNLRHLDLLERARASLEQAHAAARADTPEEFVLADLNEARARLEEITGARTADDVLVAIFSKFCIGK